MSKKTAILLATVMFLLTLPMLHAHAGDVAQRDIIGFSADGGFFAFEQYGRQDGSGFPYSEIFIIDTKHNKWVKGSPFRVLIKKENAKLRAARRNAKSQASSLLSDLKIHHPGRVLASNPISELDTDPHKVRINPLTTVSPIKPSIVFRIKEFPLPTPRCKEFMDKPVHGLELIVRKKPGLRLTLHEDQHIPKSRGCPLRYAIHDVITSHDEMHKGDTPVYIVIVAVFKLGFEGADVRYIAAAYLPGGS